MKNKDFEKAITDLQDLFSNLAGRGVLTESETNTFNEAQKSIICYYNFLTGKGTVIYPWTDESFIEAWNLWKAYKKQQHGFTYKPIGEQSALERLAEISKGNADEAIKILKTARGCGWHGFFPEKEKHTSKSKPSQVYKQKLTDRLIYNQR